MSKALFLSGKMRNQFYFKVYNLFSRLTEAEKPFCERLHRVRDLMGRSKVSIEEVISELGQYPCE